MIYFAQSAMGGFIKPDSFLKTTIRSRAVRARGLDNQSWADYLLAVEGQEIHMYFTQQAAKWTAIAIWFDLSGRFISAPLDWFFASIPQLAWLNGVVNVVH